MTRKTPTPQRIAAQTTQGIERVFLLSAAPVSDLANSLTRESRSRLLKWVPSQPAVGVRSVPPRRDTPSVDGFSIGFSMGPSNHEARERSGASGSAHFADQRRSQRRTGLTAEIKPILLNPSLSMAARPSLENVRGIPEGCPQFPRDFGSDADYGSRGRYSSEFEK